MRKYRSFIAVFIAAVCLWAVLPAALTRPFSQPGAALAEEDWQAEYEAICGKTQDAMSLSPAELGGLIERCDKLEPKIESLDGTKKKVYMKRLKMCRDLFSFTLESKEKSQP